MKRRCIKAGCLILGMGMGLLWCEPCHAVLNLWISYYFQGDANYAVGEYSDAQTLLARARQEHCKDKDEAWRLACNLDSIGVNEMAL